MKTAPSKNVHRLAYVLLGVLVFLLPQLGAAQVAVSTWGFGMDLIDKNVTNTFEEAFSTEILYDLGNNADRITKIELRKDNPNIDAVEFAPTFALRAANEGLLETIDYSRIEGLDELHEWAVDPLGNGMGVGFTIYSYGIVYRTDKISEPITSWQDLWREDLSGKVSLPNITTTQGPSTVVMASRAWGGDENNPDVGFEKLAELSETNVVTFYARSSELISLFQQEEVWAAPVLRFAWGSLQQTGLPLTWVAPAEGSVGFVNTISIVKGAPNLDGAYDYINHKLSHDVQSAQALDLVDSPVNATVDVPAEQAASLTYGDEEIGNLIFLDYNYLLSVEEEWISRWNEEIAR
ncbi:MAG: ABC transporter substrate-binding protein [Trueperaceae bacterium]|nr:MAG: ABC transporter substrate-binding protein [Trueperaceae bacterium]